MGPAPIDQDPEDPRAEPFRIATGERAVRPHERLLKNVLSVGPFAQHPEGVSSQSVSVTLHQLSIDLALSREDPAEQLRVVFTRHSTDTPPW